MLNRFLLSECFHKQAKTKCLWTLNLLNCRILIKSENISDSTDITFCTTLDYDEGKSVDTEATHRGIIDQSLICLFQCSHLLLHRPILARAGRGLRV